VSTRTVPQRAERVIRRIYGARIRDLSDGQLRIDYVGKTKRSIAIREAEHRGLGRNPEDEQPWSDLAEGPFVELDSDERSSWPWSEAEHKARERWWIRNEGGRLPHRPRYNWEFNADCPGQIPKWVAAEARGRRDAARGVTSRWTNPELFVARRPVQSAKRSLLAALWRWLSATVAFRVFVSWLVLTLAVCVAVAWGSHAVGHLVPVSWALGVSAVASLGLHIWQWNRIRRWLRRI
jgi:hypothetical protein